jgi:hypothetical protein
MTVDNPLQALRGHAVDRPEYYRYASMFVDDDTQDILPMGERALVALDRGDPSAR